jgi:pilus assembly protein CpaB
MSILNPKFIVILAIISGAIATYGVSHYLKEQKLNSNESVKITKPVAIATQDLKMGQVISSDDVQLKDWPLDIIPAGSYSDMEMLINRVLKTDIGKAEAILAMKLAPDGATGGVSSLIPDGMRAITVAVNIVSGVAGFILPNTRVDVLTTVSPSNNKSQTTTKTILQNVMVLAVDQTVQKNDNDPVTVKSVTLLVTPDQAEKLTLASTEGKLQLVLRNSSDIDEKQTAGVGIPQLITKPRQAPRRRTTPRPVQKKVVEPKEEKPVSRTVEVIRSNKRSEVVFEEENKADSTKLSKK